MNRKHPVKIKPNQHQGCLMDPFLDIWPFSLLLLSSFSRRPCPKPTANTWPLWEHEKVISGQFGSLEINWILERESKPTNHFATDCKYSLYTLVYSEMVFRKIGYSWRKLEYQENGRKLLSPPTLPFLERWQYF